MLRPVLKIALFVLLLVSVYFAGTLSSSAMGAKKVEYKVVRMAGQDFENAEKFEALLNKMGADGWELVLAFPIIHNAVFKR